MSSNGSDNAGNEADANAQLNGNNDADLFGSASENEEAGDKSRRLSDAELDSGDDEGRGDRADDHLSETKEATHTREENVLDVSIGRHPIPRPSDGELYLLQFPSFLGIEPKAFTPNDWKPPVSDHHTTDAPSSTFSAYNTSNNTIRWRHSPSDPDKIQSNARVLRWSDGSMTVQLASNPTEQFALSAKALAPPQINPFKPTPTSLHGTQANGKAAYNARFDSHTYLASPHEAVSLLQITNHVTSSLAVQSYKDQDDDATIKLQESMAAATKGHKGIEGVEIMHITEDPELAKKKAEVAQKELQRAARRRQQQEEKERERSNKVLGRSGLRTGGFGGGLTVGGLEDDQGMGRPSRPRPSKPKAKKPRRRNSEYSDEEEFANRGRTREDEYDEDDGFLVGSDEEPELVADESGEEEDVDMAEERPKKKSSQKEPPVQESAAATAGSPRSRAKRRRIVDDEDEDE